MERTLLTEREAARKITWSVFTMRNKRVQGKGPRYIKLGRSVRYDLKDIEDFIAKNVVETIDSRVKALK